MNMIIEVMVKLYQIKMQMMIVAINKHPSVVFLGWGIIPPGLLGIVHKVKP